MSEKEYNANPFTPFQYEHLKGNWVQKKEYEKNVKEINEKLASINEMSMNNTKNLKMILSVLKWLGGIAGALVLSQMFDFFINLGGK